VPSDHFSNRVLEPVESGRGPSIGWLVRPEFYSFSVCPGKQVFAICHLGFSPKRKWLTALTIVGNLHNVTPSRGGRGRSYHLTAKVQIDWKDTR